MFQKYLLLPLFLVSLSARADYEPTLLPSLVSKASLIIEARIVSINSRTILLKPIRVLKGKSASPVVIDRFKNWTCSSRFAPYAVNQQGFYFLEKSETGHFTTLGAANEGEVPLFKEAVYYQTAYLQLDKNPRLFSVYNGQVRGYKYVKSSFEAAIEQLIRWNSMTNYLKDNARALADTTRNLVLQRAANEYLETHYLK